jgi:serine/threonine protein kinase
MDETFPRPFNADYELLGELGKGGMGCSVYKARQIKLNKEVALKVLDAISDNEAEREEAEKRFYNEAQAIKNFDYQYLATGLDYGTHGNKLFIAMTFVDGEPLSDFLKKKKTLPVDEAIYIAWQIANGLERAHQQGVVHRDIKPSNIMMQKKGDIKIIDFGISITEKSQRLTNPGSTMGTPEYMSPEQCQNKNVSFQSDIYSFGIVFYEMLSGNPPFIGGSNLSILNRHLHETPTSLRKKNAEVSEALEKIIFKCLEKSTELRYKNFTVLIEELKTVMNKPIAHGTPKSLMGRLSNTERIIFLILCGILPALLILMLLLLSFKNPPEKNPLSITYLKPNKSWVVQSVQPEIPVTSLFDADLSTAWIISKNSALKANNGVLITIRFAKPLLVSSLGIAIGCQSDWDCFQKYNKPKDIWLRYANSSVKEYKVNEQSSLKKISLEDKLGVQYVSWTPVEVTEFMFELKSLQSDSKNDDLAISEIRIFGMEL